jgi:hypothetical protein
MKANGAVHLKHKLLFLPLLAGNRLFPGCRLALFGFYCPALLSASVRFGLGVFFMGSHYCPEIFEKISLTD